jgi:hypothetical protein
MAFCANCGSQHDETTNACVNCGNVFRVTEPDTATLFAESARQTKLEEQQRAAAERLEAKKAKAQQNKERRQASKKRIIDALNKKKALWYPIMGVVGLAATYGIAQLVLFSINGPEQKLRDYIAAIQNGDFNALEDQTLFPGATFNTPRELVSAFDTSSVAQATFGSVNRSGLTATAQILSDSVGSKSFELQLTAVTDWQGIFQVPVWVVSTQASPVYVEPRTEMSKKQNISFGSSESITVAEAQSLGKFYSLPGFYTYSVDAYGFIGQSNGVAEMWDNSGYRPIQVTAEDAFPTKASAMADKSARATANKCASKKCAALPRYKVGDFNLWSQYDRDTYTNSRFKYKNKVNSCTQTSAIAVSAETANFTYSCSVTSRGHLYVRYVYYYGYFSDYWYYWNFYDTKENTIEVVVTETSNSTGSKVKVTSSKAR